MNRFRLFSIICIECLLFTIPSNSQIQSGEYSGLNLAFNPNTKKITGYFEMYSGIDQMFSCIFYMEGNYTDSVSKIRTYYPENKDEDLINGNIHLIDSTTISISLPEEHGGCWNVYHFADTTTDWNFKIAKKTNWIEISYITADKAFFYREKSENTKRKACLLKNDIIYIDKIEDNWIHCIYSGKSITEGWIKLNDIYQ